jgi:hypothetical protein
MRLTLHSIFGLTLLLVLIAGRAHAAAPQRIVSLAPHLT